VDRAKPFEIPKREVWEAYKRVRANQGAAGVDGQSIAEFEADLGGQLLQALESHVVRQLLSSASAAGRATKGRWRHATFRNTVFLLPRGYHPPSASVP
jgi:hypothetical protein